MKKLLALVFVTAATLVVSAQGVHRDLVHKPLADAWPTYSGDYSGKRYSGTTAVSGVPITPTRSSTGWPVAGATRNSDGEISVR